MYHICRNHGDSSMIKNPSRTPPGNSERKFWHPRWLIVEGSNLWIAGIFKDPLNPQNLGKWIQVKLGNTNITYILRWERYSSLVIKSFTVLYPGKFMRWLPITECFCVGITWRFFLLHSSKNGFHVPTSGKKKSCRSEQRMPYDSNWNKHHVSASSLCTNIVKHQANRKFANHWPTLSGLTKLSTDSTYSMSILGECDVHNDDGQSHPYQCKKETCFWCWRSHVVQKNAWHENNDISVIQHNNPAKSGATIRMVFAPRVTAWTRSGSKTRCQYLPSIRKIIKNGQLIT